MSNSEDNSNAIKDCLLCNNLYSSLLESISDGVYVLDLERKIAFWNKPMKRITGYTESEVVGEYCDNGVLMCLDDVGVRLCQELCPATYVVKKGGLLESDLMLRHKTGYQVPVNVKIQPLRDNLNHVIGALAVIKDRSEGAKIMEEVAELRNLALIDPLVEVGNRRFVEMNIAARFEELHRYSWNFGVFYLDIDSFKKINDSYGHDTGDRVLQIVSRTLQNATRVFDVIGRMGGDEFIVLLTNVDNGRLKQIATRLSGLLARLYVNTEKAKVKVSVSAGATIASDADSWDTLFKRVDGLMYSAKKDGGNKLLID